VSRVSIADLEDKQLEVIVDDTQLSLAIGKKGQNVRLAAKLLGWKIDIKSEEEKRQEVEQQMQAMAGATATPIEQVGELGDSILQKLVAAGITTVEALADMTPEQLEEIPGIGEKTLEKISVAVRHYFGQYEEGEERPAELVAAAEATTEAAEPAEGAESAAEAAEEKSEEATRAAEEASLDEEIDALEQDLTQSEDEPEPDDSESTGVIRDDVAEERLAELTEVGPDLDEEGAEAVAPGNEDTSETLVEHETHPEAGEDDAVVGGNVEQVRDEEESEK
jgi:transcription termination/antitermination protein NusA